MNYQHILLGVLLCCLALLLVPVAGSLGDMGDDPSSAESGETPEIPADVLVDETLQDASGTVELIITFETDRVGDLSTGTDAVEQLQTESDRAQVSLETFAAGNAAVSIERQFWLTNAALVSVETDRVAVEELAQLEGVERLTPNFEVKSLGAETVGVADVGTAEVAATYGVDMVRAPEVWEQYDSRGEGAIVTVIDTGVDPDHPDINLTEWAEFDAYGNEIAGSEPQDFGEHGTHVSGTVAGGNASGEYIGVAPGVELHHGAALTNCSSGCTGTFTQIVGAMEWGVENGADVLSMSLGAEGYHDYFIDPVRNAHNAGTTVVAASGNEGEGTSYSPGNVYDAISVGAVDWNEDVAEFSSGEEIDTLTAWDTPPADWPLEYVVPSVSAPGVMVKSAVPGGGYQNMGGTSMATPHVAGVVALVQSVTDEHLEPEEIEKVLEDTAWKPNDWTGPEDERDTRYGSGIVDAVAAIESVDLVNASFSFDPEAPTAGEEVTFNASESTGDIESYEWDLTDDGETDAEGELITHTFFEAGDHNVTLTVTGVYGETDTLTREVTVAEPDGPVAFFSVSPSSPQPGEETVFDASNTIGDINETDYEWDLTDDGLTDETGETVNYTYTELEEGPLTVTLTVTDSGDKTDTEVRPLYVGLEPLPGYDNPPQDVTGDGLYRDLTVDDEFTIADVQALFLHRNADEMQNHVPAYDFTGSGDISIFDVQQLFNEFKASGS